MAAQSQSHLTVADVSKGPEMRPHSSVQHVRRPLLPLQLWEGPVTCPGCVSASTPHPLSKEEDLKENQTLKIQTIYRAG